MTTPSDDIDLAASRRLVGLELSGVTFVRDYFQLLFDSDRMSVYSQTTIDSPVASDRFPSSRARNALCDLIGRHIVEASIRSGSFALLKFDDGVTVTIPLETAGPESFCLEQEGQTVVVR